MDNRTYVSLSANDALAAIIAEGLAGQTEALDVLNRWTTLSIQAPNSTVTLASRAISTDGFVGQYSGTVVLPYQKRSLQNLFPYPLVYPTEYPTSWVMLKTYLQNSYGIFLEEGEVSIDGNGITDVLSNTDRIDATPDPLTGVIALRASENSGRFVKDSLLYVIPTADGVPVALETILHLDTRLDYLSMTDHFTE